MVKRVGKFGAHIGLVYNIIWIQIVVAWEVEFVEHDQERVAERNQVIPS